MPSKSKHNKKQQNNSTEGELRIIGGQWKRSKLVFPLLDGVRPTPSRVRETLFNWLSADIHNSICLDLFAGSGALGFEALSRGAKKVFFVDKSAEICRYINKHTQRLGANAEILQADAMDFAYLAKQIQTAPDIIFCDPPFKQNLVPPMFNAISSIGWLSSGTHIYIETEASLTELPTPSGWQLIREKKAGGVMYRLYLTT